MTELLSHAIQKVISEYLDDNKETIRSSVLNGVNTDMTTEEICSLMILNSVSTSISMSVHVIIEILLESGIIEISDEPKLRKLLLSVVKE